MDSIFKLPCDCPGHHGLFVEHVMACCGEPHLTEEQWREKMGFKKTEWVIDRRTPSGQIVLSSKGTFRTPEITIESSTLLKPEAVEALASRVLAALNDLEVHVEDITRPWTTL